MKPVQAPRFFCILTLLFLAVQSLSVQAQVTGCTDPSAYNYNPAATVNDGNCKYNSTAYTPPIKVDPISNVVVESSGLQMAGNFLWSFNDGGGAAAIYRIDTVTNAILQTVNLGGATNVDWEDIAFDGIFFYIGDFGNNADGARTDLKIYKFRLSDIPDYTANANVTIPAEQVQVLNFTYSDQVPVVATTDPNTTKYDCEAMIVDGGKIHLFSKNWVNINTTHYLINDTAAGTYVAMPLETLPTNYLVTAADKAPGSNLIVLLGYQNTGLGNHFMHLLYDYSGGLYFNGNKRQIDLPTAAEMGQAEGLAFRNARYGYISNERFERTKFGLTVVVEQKLRSFNLDAFSQALVLPIKLKSFTAVKQNSGNQVSWSFASEVKELKLQYSTNRVDFITLKTYSNSSGGNFLHQPIGGLNCYRLAWKESNGMDQYSDVVCLNNEVKTGLTNLVLSSSGELSFLYNNNQSRAYTFRVLSVDGKLMAQTATQIILPGTNKIKFPKMPSRNAIVLLQAVGDKEEKNLLLKVE